MAQPLHSKSPSINYALRGGSIQFPGTQAQADAAERLAEDQIEEYLGVGSSVLLNTLTITIAS